MDRSSRPGWATGSPEPGETRLAPVLDERDVFDGIARGLSNSEITHELIASESTIKTHVGSVLRKLGLRDRVQVVVFSYEHGLRR